LLSHAGEDDVYTQDNSGNSFSNVFWLVVQNLVNFSTTRQLRQLVLKRLLYSDFRLVVQNLVNFSTTRQLRQLVLKRLLYSDFRLVVQNLVNFSTTRLVLNRLLYSD